MVEKIQRLEEPLLTEVAALWLAVNCQAHDFIPAKYWQHKLPEVKAMLPQAELLIWRQEKQLVGFMGLQGTYIAGIFVAGSCQGQGIGGQLLAQAKRTAAELTLQVYQKNTGAIDFYMKQGFKIIEEGLDPETQAAEFMMRWSRSEELQQ